MLNELMDINNIRYDQLVIRSYPNRRLTREIVHHINGLDTETLDGYVKLLTDDQGRKRDIESVEDALEFLTYRRYRSAGNFFYNIRFDYQSILKYLPKDNLLELYSGGKTDYQEYRIKYIPKRLLSINRDKNVYRYFDLAQFYEMSLEEAARKYTRLLKNEDKLDRAAIGTSAQYWDDHYDEIVKYCIQDSKITAQLGVILRDTLISKIGLLPQSYISKSSLSKEYFRRKCNIPNVQDIPEAVVSMFLNAYSAGRFEVVRKGFIPGCIAVDIVSAYSKAITLLPDVTRGQWRPTHKPTKDVEIGVYLAQISSFDTMIGAHRFRLKNGLIVYPMGTYTTYLTRWEYDVLKEDCHIKVLRGWEYFDNEPVYPFAEEVTKLFRLKQQTPKSEYEYDLYKKINNSLYGSFYEKVKQGDKYLTGKLFNPVYATLITAWCRMLVYKLMRDYADYVVSVATDGVILDKKPKLNYGSDLGQWSIEGQGELVIIRSGLYRIGDKIRERGIRSFQGIKTEYGEYGDIFEYILDHPKRQCYPIVSERPLNLGECIMHHNKLSLNDLNVFTPVKYTVTINKDFKRIWDGEFSHGGEIFEREIASRPLFIGN